MDVLCGLPDHLRSCAASAEEGMEAVRVQRDRPGNYTVCYVSEHSFADGDCFPYFIGMVHSAYPARRFRLRHIRDVDGHFVTREEYARRKK